MTKLTETFNFDRHGIILVATFNTAFVATFLGWIVAHGGMY